MYSVVSCSDCKDFFLTQAVKRFVCPRCGKSKKIGIKTVFFETEDVQEARKRLKYYKEITKIITYEAQWPKG